MDKLSKLLLKYQVPEHTLKLLKKAEIVFLVGVSGAGKDTILRELLKTGEYQLVVSHTTRPPRENHGVMERNGREYYFIDYAQAAKMLENHAFIEAKIYNGNVYGTSISEIEAAHRKHKIALSDLEVQGVAEYMAVATNVIPIFILPPDFETWQARVKNRYSGKVDSEDIQKRLQISKQELQEALSKDYFQYIVNKDLSKTVKIVDEIAHGNFSDTKNQQAREVAKTLLAKLG